MKVVLFNWAPIWKGALTGGGVNGYLHGLAPELVLLGHEVTSITSGLLYTNRRRGCFSRRHDDFRGVRVIEIINSPVLAPSAAQFREPMAEVSSPELEAEVARLMDLLRPDVAHWHNIEGFSVGCVDACRRAGTKVVYSLHNYHTLCSQVTLCRGHERPCMSFESGHACSTCIEAPDPASERERRCRDFDAEWHGKREARSREYAEALALLRHELGWPVRVVRRGVRAAMARRELRRIEGLASGVTTPGTATDTSAELEVRRVPAGAGLRVALPVLGVDRHDSEYARRAGGPLDNVPRRDPTSGRPLGAHARRRSAMVSMLGRCDRVLAVSDFVRHKYEIEGVPQDRIRTHRIGTCSATGALPAREWRESAGPMRLAFLGFNHFNKGLPLLLAAMKGMRGEDLRRMGLSIYAPGVQSIGPEFRRLCPPLAELTIRDSYQADELFRILRGHDLCYVGSSWWDPLPQTALESLACGTPVLGAEAGGIPEAVREGENGFLFRANDPASLRRRLVEVLDRHERGDWPREIVPPRSMHAHAESLVDMYRELLGEGHADRAHPGRDLVDRAQREEHSDLTAHSDRQGAVEFNEAGVDPRRADQRRA